MNVQQQVSARAPIEAPADEELELARALVGQLTAPDRATLFNQTVAKLARRRSADVLEFFRQVIELPALQGLDLAGRSCRAAVVEAWLNLGYPYALELDPAHLELRDGQRSRAAVTVASVIAMVLYGGVLLLTLVLGMGGSAEPLLAVIWAALFAHSVATLFAARAGDGTGNRRLRILSSASLLSVVLMSMALALDPSVMVALSLVLTPLVATSVAAFFAARPPSSR